MQRFKRPENTKEIKEQLEIVPVEEIKDVLKLTGIIDEERKEMIWVYQNLILDFSGAHSYLKEGVKTEKIAYIDCTDITEANMYCSETAERDIKGKVAK